MSAGPVGALDRIVGQHRRGRFVRRDRRGRFLRLRIARGELLFLAGFDVGDVGADHPLGIAHRLHRPAVQPQRLVAEALDQAERVRHQQDRLAAPLELGELVEALVGEAFVADGEHFVDEQHVGIDVDRDRETQPHVHARRVGLHRRVDEVAQLGELDDLVEAPGDLPLGQAEHDAVDEDVLAAGDLRVEAGAELDQRRDPAVDRDRAVVGLVMPATSLSSVLLPEPLRPMTPSVRPLGTRERHVAARAANVSSGLQVADQAPRQQRALQRRELPPAAVAPVDLRDVRKRRWRSRHTSSANESRSRSNTK